MREKKREYRDFRQFPSIVQAGFAGGFCLRCLRVGTLEGCLCPPNTASTVASPSSPCYPVIGGWRPCSPAK